MRAWPFAGVVSVSPKVEQLPGVVQVSDWNVTPVCVWFVSPNTVVAPSVVGSSTF